MKKKIYNILLSALTLIAFSSTSYGQGGTTGNVTWKVENGTLTLTGEGVMTNFTDNSVPWYYQREAITSVVVDERFTTIGNWAFEDCPNLVSATIPSGLTTIGANAFYLCGSLSEINIPDGLTIMRDHAFYGCGSLVIDKLPSSLTSIGSAAFSSSSGLGAPQFPSYLKIPDAVTMIGMSAFSGNLSIDTVVLPNALTVLNDHTFQYCSNLSKVVFNDVLLSIGTQAFFKSGKLDVVKLPNTLTTLKDGAFSAASIDTLYFPASVTSFGSYIFGGANIDTIIFIGDLKAIANTMFAGCTFKNFTLPASVDTIGTDAFRGCTALTSIDVSNVKVIKEGAFYGTGLISFTVPESITYLEKNMFNNCKSLNSITLHDNLIRLGDSLFKNCTALETFDFSTITTIGNGTFYGCTGLTSVSFEKTNTYIGNSAFANCTGLTSFDFPSEVTEIYANVLRGCTSLKSISTSAKIRKINESAFRGCTSLESITMPKSNSNTEIAKNVFTGCTSIESITIPSTVNKLGDSVFSGCTNLKYLFFQATAAPTATVNTFAGTNTNMVIAVPSSSLSTYKNASVWKNLTNLIGYTPMGSILTFIVADTVVIMGSGTISNFYDITVRPWHGSRSRIAKVHFIGDSITSIGYNTFRGLTALTSINLPELNTFLGANIFNGCTALTTIKLPKALNNIGDSAFANCEALTSVIMNNPIPPIINANVFAGINLSEATLSVPAENIAEYKEADVWKDFGTIKEAVAELDWDITNGVLKISGEGAMEDYTEGGAPWNSNRDDITALVIEEGITSVGDYAFYSLPRLETINFGSTVTEVGAMAFADCDSINTFTLANPLPATIGEDAFLESRISDATLYVPYGTKAAYLEADGWKAFGIIRDSVGGTTGNLDWSLVDSVFTISGEDDMPDYAESTPWTAYKSGIKTIVVKDGVKTIGNNAFHSCNTLTTIDFGSTVTSIGMRAFDECTELTEIQLPNSVTTIGTNAFSGSNKVTDLILGSGVTTINNNAFNRCTGLETVTALNPTPIAINANVFGNITLANVTLKVPHGTKAAYEDAEVWKEFGTINEEASSIRNDEKHVSLKVYPNPASELIHIESSAQVQAVVVYNTNGAIVLRQNKAENFINISGLAQGTYILKVTTDKGEATHKIVKK